MLMATSLPSRERGLKFHSGVGPLGQRGSLPSRERGLKCRPFRQVPAARCVAPFTGAWIEMIIVKCRERLHLVAPFTGAWIEIDLRAVKQIPVSGRSLHGSVD